MNLQNTKVLALYIRKSYLFLFVSLLVSLSLYVYFLFASIYNTALIKESQVLTNKILSEISELESEYVTAYDALAVERKDKTNSLVKISKKDKSFIKTDTLLGRAD